MPVRIRRVAGGYRVTNGGKVSAKRTSKVKAERQANLLRAIEHGWRPTGQHRIKAGDIVHQNGDGWVLRDPKAYYVMVDGVTHATSDSAYAPDADGLSIAIARAEYLARRRPRRRAESDVDWQVAPGGLQGAMFPTDTPHQGGLFRRTANRAARRAGRR